MSNANIGIVLNLTGIVEQPEAGVTSFNGRKGDVTPQTGDYTASQVGARPSTWTPTAADVGAVPATRKVNNKALSSDISLTASDVGAAAASHGAHVTFSATAPKIDGTAAVGTAGTVARSDHVHPTDTSRAAASHTHTKRQITDFPSSMPASDVSAWAKASAKPSYTAAEVGAVPTTRKVNNKALSADISLTASDVGAATSGHTHTAAQVGALPVTGGTMTGTITVPVSSDATPDLKGSGSYDKTTTIAAKFYRIEDASDTTKSYHAFRFTVAPTAVPEDESLVLKGIKTPVKDTDAANKKYVDSAVSSVNVGVTSFNGRTGSVTPASGDYTAAQVGALPICGGTLTGNLTIKGSGNYGTKINLGDGDYVHIAEPTDDCLEIKAKKINFVTSDTTGAGFTRNGTAIGGNVDLSGYATKSNPEFTGSISMGRKSGTTVGSDSVTEGLNTTASGSCSHAEGSNTTASGSCSHAEGDWTEASGICSHAEGSSTTASGNNSNAEGGRTTASGIYSHAEGIWTTASGRCSHSAGDHTIASAASQMAIGICNVEFAGSTPDAVNSNAYFIIGKGVDAANRANAFRVGSSKVWGGTYSSSGADYAELFEWADGNPDGEDRAGRFVTLDGDKIRFAEPGDSFILGIVSGNPSVVGDVHDDQWHGMYLYDIFGRPIWEDVNVLDETFEEPDPENPGQTITRVIVPAHMERRQKLNPQYDSSQTYIPRSERPEWDAVGMMGKLVAVDDGNCQINGWCTAGTDGIATASENRSGWRVMERIDETHIRVLALQGGKA